MPLNSSIFFFVLSGSSDVTVWIFEPLHALDLFQLRENTGWERAALDVQRLAQLGWLSFAMSITQLKVFETPKQLKNFFNRVEPQKTLSTVVSDFQAECSMGCR